MRIRVAYVERSTGGLVLGPLKSKAGRRVVGIPKDIVSALREHIATYVQDEPGEALKDLMARMGHDNVRAAMTRRTWCRPGDHGRDRSKTRRS